MVSKFIPDISEVEFYCEYNDESKSNLSCAIIYFVVDNYPLPDDDYDQATFALVYGDSGGGTQGDWLFASDPMTQTWKYSDSTGDEWKGARQWSDESNSFDQEVSTIPGWSEADTACLSKLNEYWNKYFIIDSNENINFSETVFNEYQDGETKAISNDFDWDVLFNVSPTWNLLIQYRDPYYEKS